MYTSVRGLRRTGLGGLSLRRTFAAAKEAAPKVDQRQLVQQREREQKRVQFKRETAIAFEKLRTEARQFREMPHTMDVPSAMRYIRAAEVGEPAHAATVSLQIRIVAERGVQRITGALRLPHGLKEERLCVITSDSELADQARKAGASIVGSDELIAKIRDDSANFLAQLDRIYATPEMMSRISQVARILGPKGLMPNAKRGTVITQVYDTIVQAKGETTYKQVNDMLILPVARASFSDAQVVSNILASVNAIRGQLQAVPSAKKGQLGKTLLSSTRSPSIAIVV